MDIILRGTLYFLDDPNFDSSGEYNKEKRYIETIIHGLFRSSMNVCNIDIYDYFTDEILEQVVDEFKHQIHSWKTSKTNDLTIETTLVPYNSIETFVNIGIGMRKPYLTITDLDQDYRAADMLCSCNPDKCDKCRYGKICEYYKNIYKPLEGIFDQETKINPTLPTDVSKLTFRRVLDLIKKCDDITFED